MNAGLTDTLLLAGLTYFAHSSVFLLAAWALTAGSWIRKLPLKEFIWRLALFGGLVTTALQLSGAGNLVLDSIHLPHQAAVTVASPEQTGPAAHWRSSAEGPALAARPSGSPVATPPRPASAAGAKANIWTPSAWLGVWGLLALAALVRLVWLLRNLDRQLSGREPLLDDRAAGLLQRLAAEFRVPAPALSCKTELHSPFCLASGEIVLPDWALELPDEQLRALLAHELAHLERRDPQWLIAGRVLQSLLFFQPLNLVALRKLEELSEFACDGAARRACGTGRALAECLAECTRRRIKEVAPALGVAMATRRSPLIQRAHRLLEGAGDDGGSGPGYLRALILGVFVTAGVVMPGFAWLDADAGQKVAWKHESPASRVSVDINGTTILDMSIEDGDRTLKIEGKGRFRFNDAETDMVAINDGGHLDIEEVRGGQTRRVRFDGKDGAVQTQFWLNGKEHARDADMDAWLARVIPDLYRQSGIDAEGRTRRIYAARGADGVLDELDQLGGSYTLRMYTSTLVGLGSLDNAQALRLLHDLGQISSSYDLRESLTAVAKQQDLSEEAWHAFATTAKQISSSYDLRETLASAAPRIGESARSWRAMLEVAGQVSSGYDLRETLVAFGPHLPKDAQTIGLLASVAGHISSGYDLREALSAYARQGGFDESGWLALLDSVKGISSDYDRRETLVAFAANMPRQDSLLQRYREVAAGISSKHEREEALKAI